MKKTHRDPIVRLLKEEGRIGNGEKMEEWLKDSSNRRAYESLKKIWQASGEVYGDYSPDKETAWASIEKRISTKRERTSGIVPLWKWAGRVAAAFLLIAGATWGLLRLTEENQNHLAGLQAIATGSAIDSITLEDGTMIWLNSQTTLRYPATFPENERKVYLSGEAYFQVAGNAEKPFIIEARETLTQVLGTSFNIRTEKRSASIEVVSGKVSFSESGNPANAEVLIRGERAEFNHQNRQIDKTDINDPNFLAWKTGILVFNNAPLSDVVEQLTRYYNKAIKIDLPDPDSLSLTASFERQNLEEALEVISMTLDLQYKKTSEGYLLKK